MSIEREWRCELRPYAPTHSDQRARRRVISGPHGFRATIWIWLVRGSPVWGQPTEFTCYAPNGEYIDGMGISAEGEMTVAIRSAFVAIRAAYDAHLLGVLASVV